MGGRVHPPRFFTVSFGPFDAFWVEPATWSTIYIWMFPKIGIPPNHPFLIGFSIINRPFWDISIFGNAHICSNSIDPMGFHDRVFGKFLPGLDPQLLGTISDSPGDLSVGWNNSGTPRGLCLCLRNQSIPNI